MSNKSSTNLDHIRQAALDKTDRLEKTFFRSLLAASAFEAVALIAVLVTMDFGDKLHLLIFFCALMVYGTLALGLITLGVRISFYTQRILKALELSASGEPVS